MLKDFYTVRGPNAPEKGLTGGNEIRGDKNMISAWDNELVRDDSILVLLNHVFIGCSI